LWWPEKSHFLEKFLGFHSSCSLKFQYRRWCARWSVGPLRGRLFRSVLAVCVELSAFDGASTSIHSFGSLATRSGGGRDTHTSERPCTCCAPLRPASGSRKRQIYILLPLSSPSETVAYAASRET